jgi:drug/metabolite transporter (DMT)-like permease
LGFSSNKWTKLKETMLSNKKLAQLEIFFSGILMGTAGLFILSINFLSTFAIVALRGLFGFVFAIVILLVRKPRVNLVEVLRNAPFLFILQACISPFISFFYFYSIQHAGFGPAAFLLKTGPVYSVILLAAILHKKPRKKEILALIASILGVLILTSAWNISQLESSYFLGLGAGILSGIILGVANAVRVITYDKIETKFRVAEFSSDSPFPTKSQISTVMLLLEILLTFLIFTFLDGSYFAQMSFSTWLIAAGLGIFASGLPFFLRNKSLQQDEGGDVLLFSYSEILMGTFLTAVLDHALTWHLIVGGALIFGANFYIFFHPKSSDS